MDRREYQDRWRERIRVLQETDPAVQKILAGEEMSPSHSPLGNPSVI
jgi:hypothetical protein